MISQLNRVQHGVCQRKQGETGDDKAGRWCSVTIWPIDRSPESYCRDLERTYSLRLAPVTMRMYLRWTVLGNSRSMRFGNQLGLEHQLKPKG